MTRRAWNVSGIPAVIAAALMITAGPAFSEKPGWVADKGKGHGNNVSQEDSGSERDRDSRYGNDKEGHGKKHFEDHHRVAVHNYYAEEFRGGNCPRGLAKKHNGCMPPGQAKKWKIGKPLPRDVIYYSVPQPLVVQIGLPPAGYRYVRVAGDILLIAIGTGMVIDAIQDLGR